MGRWRERIALFAFLAAILGGTWVAGALSARFGVFPYPAFNRVLNTLRDAVATPDRFHRAVHDFEGVRITKPDRIAPGFTLITTYFPDKDWHAGIRLIDRDGKVVHDWNLDFSAILPGRQPQQDFVHGSQLLPNGDIIFNVAFAGLVRLDRCSNLVWQNEDIDAHHSVAPAADGGFWVSGNITRDDNAAGLEYLKQFQILNAPIYEDTFVKVSPEGEVLKEISSIDVLYRNNLQRLLTKMGRGKIAETGARKGFSGDIFHLNDIEELSPEMAAEYPLFEAGDIVVSLRQLHAVMVVDPDDLRVKWYTITATISQHDPDFIGDGWIGIFDNNLDLTRRGTVGGGTRILAVRPHTGEEKVLYPVGSAGPIYTDYGGKWQLLPNGNYLLTIAREGRALEVTAQGDTVWEWVTPRYGTEDIPEVLEATRYDIPAETIAGWTCEG